MPSRFGYQEGKHENFFFFYHLSWPKVFEKLMFGPYPFVRAKHKGLTLHE